MFKRLPMPFDNVKIFSEIAFTHTVTFTPGTVVSGCVDHSIGRVLDPTPQNRKRRFQSLLLAVEAKKMHNLDLALPQLVVYLASIRESHLSQGQSDASVYGIASDGYTWIFVAITNDGILREE